jgi:hypothetical protein
VLLNLAILVVSGLSDVLGAIRRILLSYLVHMHSRLSSLRQGQVHVVPITWEVLPHPIREAKRARGGAKSTAAGSGKPPPAAKPAVLGPSKSSAGARVVASSAGKPPSAEPTKERRPPSSVRTDEAATGGADFDTDICVDDYLVGECFLQWQ